MGKTGNAEARMLAVQVADPQKVTQALAEKFLLGVWRPKVRKDAVAAATRIGKVDVNHGAIPA